MIRSAEELALTKRPTQAGVPVWAMEANAARVCFIAVREETGDGSAAAIPKALLMKACHALREVPLNDVYRVA